MAGKYRRFVLWGLIALLLFSVLACGALDEEEPYDESDGQDEEYYDEDLADDEAEDVDEEYTEDDGESGDEAGTGALFAFEYVECDYEDLDADVECGYLTVPEDYDNPDGAMVEIAVTIIHSPGGATYPDPVIYLEGGPGGSATQSPEVWLEQFFLEDRDLILFDQRGTGASIPSLNCPELEADDDSDEVAAAAACYERVTDEGTDVSQYHSVQAAADLAALREALGYDEWNLFGISYGTRLALVTMREQPAGIRSVILDSVYPPQVNAYEEEAVNGVSAFEILFAGCAADRACHAAYPNFEEDFYALLSDLDDVPVEFTVEDPWTEEEVDVYLDGLGLVDQVYQTLYDTATIPWIPYAIDQIMQENYEEAWILLLGGEEADKSRRQDEEEDVTDSEGLFYAIECYEEIAFSDLDAAEAAVEAVDSPLGPYLIGDVQTTFEICETWLAGTPDPVEDKPVRSDIPTLVLAGEYDPVTPPAWAEAAAKYLPNSFYYEFPGVGHSVSDSGDCAQAMIQEFLNDPESAPDATCLADVGAPAFYTP